MSRDLIPATTRPDWSTVLADYGKRIRALEAALRAKDANVFIPVPYIAHFKGPVTTSVAAKQAAWSTGIGRFVVATLTTAGSTDTIVDIIVDAVVVASLTIPSGSTTPVGGRIGVVVYAHNKIWFEVTTAGTGAEDLVVGLLQIVNAA